MTMTADSVIDRVGRVKHSLGREGDPAAVQAVVDGPCPRCGTRDVVTVRADLTAVHCDGCGHTFVV